MTNDHGLALFIHDSRQPNRAGGLRANVREPRGRGALPLCTHGESRLDEGSTWTPAKQNSTGKAKPISAGLPG